MADENQTPAGDEAVDKNIDTSTENPKGDGQKDTKKGEPDNSTSPEQKKEEGKEGQEEKVEISKKDFKFFNKLRRQHIKGKKSKKTTSSSKDVDGMFSHQPPVEVKQPTADEIANEDAVEFAKVKAGFAEMALDNSDYQKVLKGDKTLKRIMKKNPLAILDEVPIDAEDALEKIQEYFDDLVEELPDPTDTTKKTDKTEKKESVKPAPQKTNEQPAKKERKTASNLNHVEGGLKDRILGAQGLK